MGLLHEVLGYFRVVAGFCKLRQRLQSCGGWGLWVAGCAGLLWVFWAILVVELNPKKWRLRKL